MVGLVTQINGVSAMVIQNCFSWLFASLLDVFSLALRFAVMCSRWLFASRFVFFLLAIIAGVGVGQDLAIHSWCSSLVVVGLMRLMAGIVAGLGLPQQRLFLPFPAVGVVFLLLFLAGSVWLRWLG